MFEAGKLYKQHGRAGSGSYRCLSVHPFRQSSQAGVLQYVTPDGLVSSDPRDHGDIPHVYQWDGTWYEHKEPVIQKYIRTVIKDRDGSTRVVKDVYTSSTDTIAGIIELTVTDEKLTDVRIV